jgi:PAS domain-containing protein
MKPIKDDRKKLRAQAEAQLACDPTARASSQPASALVHELQVRQIELEMRNEELRRDQAEIETAHERYVDLYDFAPAGYVTLDPTGLVTGANLTAAGLLGKERKGLVGRPFADLVDAKDENRWHLFFSALARTGWR